MSHGKIHGFIDALHAGDELMLADMLARDPSLAKARNGEGVSLLMLCVYHRNRGMVDRIMSLRPPEDIHEAAATGQVGILHYLVQEHPSSINSFYADGYTPLGLAVYFGHEEAALRLLDAGADVSLSSNNTSRVAPLHSAAAAGNTRLVRILLARGAPVNARQSHGLTALHTAAHQGNLDMTTLLAEAGADIHAVTDQGKIPFDLAIGAGHEHVANYLQRMEKKYTNKHKP